MLKRSSLEHEFNSMDRDLTSQLASMPASLEGMNKLIKKQRESALAERKTREMLIADGFMDPEQAKEVMEDDAALVEIGSQRLKQLLTPLDVPKNDRLEPSTRPSRNSPEHYDDDDASSVLSDNNTNANANANGGDEDNHARRKPRRRRKRGKKKKNVARNNHNSPLSSSSCSRLLEPRSDFTLACFDARLSVGLWLALCLALLWPCAPAFSCSAPPSDQGGIDLFCTDQPCWGRNTTANPYLYAAESTRLIRMFGNQPQLLQSPRPPQEPRAHPAGSAAARALFVYLALHNVHQPVESPAEFVALYSAADYNSTNYAR